MAFYSTVPIPASRPADESQLSKHTQPTVCTVPPNADRIVNPYESAKATGTTAVGNGPISAGKAVEKGVQEFTNAVSDAASKVQSGIAQAQSAAQDPVSFVAGLAQQATGVSIPTSPQGVLDLLSKFSPPPATGDGRTDISKPASEGDSVISEIGDFASLTADQVTSKISSVSSAISQVTAPITQAAGAVTQLASLGGVPVDNVISSSVNKITSPVQSSLTKVNNVVDGTQGIIT